MDQNVAKGICIVILFLLCIVFGWLPIWLHYRGLLTANGSARRKAILDILNSFAGGVFLGTCLLHLLAEGREDFETYKEKVHYDSDFPFYEATAGVGLFLVAMVEKVAYVIMSSSSSSRAEKEGGVSAEKALSKVSTTSAFLLLVALSFHTIFDGLAVGLQTSAFDVWQVLAAVSIHKSLVAFCLGLELASSSLTIPSSSLPSPSPTSPTPQGLELASSSPTPTSPTSPSPSPPSRPIPRRPIQLMFFFSLIAPVGVGIGMGVTSSHVNEEVELLVSSLLSALATGTFFYVTFFEILGHSFNHAKHEGCDAVNHKLEFAKVGVAFLGFAAMGAVKLLDTD